VKSSISVILLSALSITPIGYGQQDAKAATAPPAVVNYTGCVAKLPKGEKYVIAVGKSCMLLRGRFDSAKIVDHTVTLRGLEIQPVDLDPLSLDVRETVAVKDACKQTCVLVPPGTRGVHGNEKPGSEGGPAGAAPPPPPPQ
jgi:hypothetical protein